MNLEEVFEQWSDIEESDESDSSSDSEEEDIDYESDEEQSWREETGKFLCIFLLCFTSANMKKNTQKHHYNKLYAESSINLYTSRRITCPQCPSFHCIPWSFSTNTK